MPIYEYKCEKCGQRYDIDREMKDAGKPLKCPECRINMTRVFGCGGIVFKGSGWTGKDLKQKREDMEIGRKVRKAKKLHTTGAVPDDEVLRLNDRVLQEDKDG